MDFKFDPSETLGCDGGEYNYPSYCNAEADSLVVRALTTLDNDEAQPLWTRYQEIVESGAFLVVDLDGDGAGARLRGAGRGEQFALVVELFENALRGGFVAPHGVGLRAILGQLLCRLAQFLAQHLGSQPFEPVEKMLDNLLLQVRVSQIREGAARVTAVQASYTERLRGEPAASIDRYVLLDAQDWMDDRQLNQLWAEITRTARPGARVIFRTAGAQSILPGRVDPAVLGHWAYQRRRSRELFAQDRSAVYGGFHLYVLGGCHDDA